MATATKDPTKPTETLADLQSQRARVASDLARALSVMNPTRFGEPSPPPDAVEAIEAPDVAARLQTELRALDAEIIRAHEAVRVTDARRVSDAVAEGNRLVRAELPALVREQRALQAKWQALHTRLTAVDHRAGGIQRAQTAVYSAMLPGSGFDNYVVHTIQAFDVSLE